MPISKRDLKMMTDNELFNGMTLVRDDGDGLNEMVDELARGPAIFPCPIIFQKSVRREHSTCAGGRSDHQPSLTAGLLVSLRAAERVGLMRTASDATLRANDDETNTCRESTPLRCYGASGEGVALSALSNNPMERPMLQSNDLSRSFTALNQDSTLIVVIDEPVT